MTSNDRRLADYFSKDHAHCDALWAAFEQAVEVAPEEAKERWEAFRKATLLHLALEEELLFPSFEQARGSSAGPTQVMRMEHERMRGVMNDLDDAVRRGDLEQALDQGDTLLLLTQQHNQKEEAILYPMAETLLQAQWVDLRRFLEERRLRD
jgi:hemerythrin-like domain-containing protein